MTTADTGTNSGSFEGRDEAAGGHASEPSSVPPPKKRKRKLMDRFESAFSRLTSRSTFFHRLGSMIWLPYAFRSGIKIKRVDNKTFSAVLPFRRFNRNWYNAMAGASLLANSEIAGGMYIYGQCGGDYTVVCKELRYKFLRPCYGPAVYRVNPMGDLDKELSSGHEFNFDIEMDIVQSLPTKGLGREVRVGKCWATFHVTPKALHEARAARRAKRVEDAPSPAKPHGNATPGTAPSTTSPSGGTDLPANTLPT